MTQRPVIARTNSGPINPSPTQLAKLRSELNIVERNAAVMSEMLGALSPEQEENGDMQLFQVEANIVKSSIYPIERTI